YSVFYNDDNIATMVEAAAAKKVVKAKKPAAKPLHPPFAVMIAGAIKALKERGGSSRTAILKYILANNKIANADKAKVSAKLAIRKMLAAKKLVPVKGSFKLAKEEPKPKKAKKVKKPAAKKVKKAKKPSAKKAVKKTAVKAKKPAKKAAKKPVAKKAAKKPAAKKVAKKPAAKKVAKK
ncbi:unnamed protein product, partial [Meganyctiphanes norvegica]